MKHFNSVLCTIMLVTWFTGVAKSQADLQIIVGSVTVDAPSTGNTFEISITNVGNTASASIAGFSFGISVPVTSGITFTDASIATILNPYLFAGNSSTPPFSNTAFPNQAFIASDFYADVGGVVINSNQTFSLGLITFDVASDAVNPTTVTLQAFPATSLSDDLANNVSFTGFNGTITLSAVPEPSTWALLVMSGVALGVWGYRRKLNHKALSEKFVRS
ncbi:MAG TPA: PEP-CTERM sorting domain-containing protein [Gemmatales bacterium]|nr:PEP-CTERM sorting domain-containing protein [Gemmatales bacterium]